LSLSESVVSTQPVCPHRVRVIRQLSEALLFEGIVPYEYDGDWFTFGAGELTYRARGKVSAFGRVRLVSDDIWQVEGKWQQPVDLATLVRALPGTTEAKEKLLQELQQTIAFCAWNQENLTLSDRRRGLDYLALESAIHEGHPYHPCFKARTGFSFSDHAQYGPEAGNRFQLCWLAVRRQFLRIKHDCVTEQAFWERELGAESFQQLIDCMTTKGIGFSDYALLPVHPWQLNALLSPLQQPLTQGHLVTLGFVGDYYQASISLRTLLNVSNPQKANIKLPLNVVNSSSLRTIEPHSVCTAPVLSQWLQKIIKQDPWFSQNSALEIQAEYAGIALQDKSSGEGKADGDNDWVQQLAPSLSAIFRDSRVINSQQLAAIPFVALPLTESDGEAFIQPWLQQYGIQIWLRRLLEVVVLPVWHLLVRHGIALETHGQNMTLLHRNGWPEKLVVRDFHESLEFVPEFLADPHLQPDFTSLHPDYAEAQPDRFYWMSSVEGLRELLVDTLFVYNLADLAYLLEQDFTYPESDFWQLVDAVLSEYAQSAHDWTERLEQLNLYQKNIQTESLLRKKLSGQSDSEFHHTIPNPLHQTPGWSLTC